VNPKNSMPSAPRDFVGYGRDAPRFAWPHGDRVALNIAINYEEGSERSFAAGDETNEILAEYPRQISSGYRDLAVESAYEYGSRAGIHRIFRLLRDYGMKCTVFASAVALEVNPDVAQWIREFDHEVCGHGLRWSEDWTVSPTEEKSRILRAIDSISRTCGVRPVGWYNRYMASEATRELLTEIGGFTYDSNAYNDDLPYYVHVRGKAHLVVPYSFTYNDVRYIVGGLSSPSDFVDLCTRSLDYLCEEGATHPKMMSIGLHPRWSGQAGRTSALRDVLSHVAKKEGVWVATRREIATWWWHKFPPKDNDSSGKSSP